MFCFSLGLGGGQVFEHTCTYQDGAGVAALVTQVVLAAEGADFKAAVGCMPA